MSDQQDTHPQGGSLSDMAVEGTTVPSSASEPRYIPSKPRPGQVTDPTDDPVELNKRDAAGEVDNAGDISRSTRDNAPTPDIVTGTGDALPAEAGSKRLHNIQQGELSKGHPRYEKHVRQKGSDQEKGASKGGEEEYVGDGVVGGR
ncbi:uncharacterized protein KY384_002247 [Bacidia gigantensis]|uniref:uncharacterized protein n=1 Tax=Bacidia gigantensis TaxID=2732470 RepID=UPI001D03888D|nr:uncharacterized protein KY384_002247 [Bacidia gigantensis]KAG8533464.1 hypothetical protein KY384_002247 [Bacidia gigantensis]